MLCYTKLQSVVSLALHVLRNFLFHATLPSLPLPLANFAAFGIPILENKILRRYQEQCKQQGWDAYSGSHKKRESPILLYHQLALSLLPVSSLNAAKLLVHTRCISISCTYIKDRFWLRYIAHFPRRTLLQVWSHPSATFNHGPTPRFLISHFPLLLVVFGRMERKK